MNDTPSDVDQPLPTPEEVAAVARIRRWNRFYKVAVIWLICSVGLIVEKIVNLGSVREGLWGGVMASAFTTPFLLIVALPLGWLGSQVGSWRKWRRYRLWITFALPLLFVLVGVGGALKGRYFPQRRFQQITGVEFPRDARMERYVFKNGYSPHPEWSCTYEFICPAEETDRLIREMKLERSGPPLAPPSKGWVMTECWGEDGRSDAMHIELQTDATHTKLWIMCFVI